MSALFFIFVILRLLIEPEQDLPVQRHEVAHRVAEEAEEYQHQEQNNTGTDDSHDNEDKCFSGTVVVYFH